MTFYWYISWQLLILPSFLIHFRGIIFKKHCLLPKRYIHPKINGPWTEPQTSDLFLTLFVLSFPFPWFSRLICFLITAIHHLLSWMWLSWLSRLKVYKYSLCPKLELPSPAMKRPPLKCLLILLSWSLYSGSAPSLGYEIQLGQVHQHANYWASFPKTASVHLVWAPVIYFL